MTLWLQTTKGDPEARALADRHYSRRTPGLPQFVKPGRSLVLLTPRANALWVSSTQKPELVRHAWPGAWECSYFRNESGLLSSSLIRAAVLATREAWGPAPPHGFVTFINDRKIRPKADPGYCFLRAGWTRLPVRTKRYKLLVLQFTAAQIEEGYRADGGSIRTTLF